jgi:hypothetical protein
MICSGRQELVLQHGFADGYQGVKHLVHCLLGVLSLAKKFGLAAVENTFATTLDMGV